ncbi:hypothetical protein N9442_03625 [Gammaproteobacteria bacterium]|nr:hypothetical protein [Gammaproteobacteria bacterium]
MKAVIYTGYAYTGGIVPGLILREFDSFIGPFPKNTEFRLFKERFALCELEDSLIETHDPEIVDLALKDFAWLFKKYARPDSFLSKTGFGLDKSTNNEFSKLTLSYIDSLTEFKYPMSWHFYDFRTKYFPLIFSRVIRRILKTYKYGRQPAHFSFPNRNDFVEKTSAYVEGIMKAFIGESFYDDSNTIMFSKAVSPYSYKRISQVVSYFDQCKVLIVDRDPRDVYIELSRSGKDRYLFDSEDPMLIAKGFNKFFRSLRIEQEAIRNHPNVLLINFEDICFRYETCLVKIYEFLAINPSLHSRKGEFFNPLESQDNVGLWRSAKGKEREVINFIESELQEFLYDELSTDVELD